MMNKSVKTPKAAWTKKAYQNDRALKATIPKSMPTGIDKNISTNGLSMCAKQEDIV